MNARTLRRRLVVALSTGVLLLGLVPMAATAAPTPITIDYGDVTVASSGGLDAGHFPHVWDLLACDVTIDATVDLTGVLDEDPSGSGWDGGDHAWSQLGVREVGFGDFNRTFGEEGAGVWLATDYAEAGTADTFASDPDGSPSLDTDDKLLLQKAGGHGEGDYDLPSTPPSPAANHRFWFDRDGVDQWQDDNLLAVDGGTYNTGGTYDVQLDLQASDATSGTAYMTVNGLQQGFETDGDWSTMELAPAGMAFTGEMGAMQVFYGLYGYGASHGVTLSDVTVTGCPAAGFVTGGGHYTSPVGAGPGDAPYTPWQQDFATGTGGWSGGGDYGVITDNGDGTAQVDGTASGPYSFFDGPRDTWPGTWTAEVDVYLDPAWSPGTGFDYSVAAWGTDGTHQRDYIFHVTSDTSTDRLLVAGSNNTNFAPREDLENGNHHEVTTAGWYTLQHVFYEQAGSLWVDMNLVDDSGAVVFTETRAPGTDDTIPAEVGGNGYGWFTFINATDGTTDGVTIDNHELWLTGSPEGTASFGFVAKYKKGANVPDGQTEFTFQAGDIDLHSTSYDWLNVTGGDYARFKGEATVNGQGGYRFMIWAGDGTGTDGADTFRIKIWTEAGGVEDVLYDNGMDTALDGGQIMVHSKRK